MYMKQSTSQWHTGVPGQGDGLPLLVPQDIYSKLHLSLYSSLCLPTWDISLDGRVLGIYGLTWFCIKHEPQPGSGSTRL